MKPFPLEQVAPEDMKPELVCGIAKTTLQYFLDKLGREVVEEVVAETRMNIDYLKHGSHWISLHYYCRMLDKLVERSGDPSAAYSAGLYGSVKEGMGAVRTLASSFLTPGAAYRFCVYSTSCWNRIAEWKILEMSRSRGVFSAQFRNGCGHTKNNCLAIQGFLASVPQLWHLPPANVREIECSCEGADACVYEVTWQKPPFLRWSLVGGLIGGSIGMALFLAGIEQPGCCLVMLLLGVSAGCNVYLLRLKKLVVSQNREQIVALEATVKEVAQISETLHQMVEQRTSELTKANRCLQEMLAQLKESRLKELQSERQAAIGTLAAGMAHEMNNPLHAVSVSVQGLKVDLQSNPEYGPFIANIERSTKRCRRIIGEILSFSRESKSSLADLQDIISAAVETFKAEHPATMTVDLEIEPALPHMFLDSAQIRQALGNLLMNASDAMNGAGHIQVGVGREADTVVISVRDSGPGMTEEVKNRLFDPFFTTKQKGMGLGLSITWQLVLKNRGTIEVESREGHGALFRIRLPIPGENS
jgi:signal transduction histidine kinase